MTLAKHKHRTDFRCLAHHDRLVDGRILGLEAGPRRGIPMAPDLANG